MDVVLLLMAWGRNTILIKNAVTCVYLHISNTLGWPDRCLPMQVDVYSFGIVLWELVTGKVPARGKLADPQVWVDTTSGDRAGLRLAG